MDIELSEQEIIPLDQAVYVYERKDKTLVRAGGILVYSAHLEEEAA
jgi:hypothetical protein